MVNLNAGTGFGWVLGESGEPERMPGPRVLVPVHNDIGGDDGIAKVLVAAAAANPLNVGNPGALAENLGFWQKIPTPQALLVHPGLVGKFFQPGFPMFPLDVLPEGTLVILRPPMMVGRLVLQGPKTGVIAHCKEGMLLVQFATR
jgi:hypothetical protein